MDCNLPPQQNFLWKAILKFFFNVDHHISFRFCLGAYKYSIKSYKINVLYMKIEKRNQMNWFGLVCLLQIEQIFFSSNGNYVGG